MEYGFLYDKGRHLLSIGYNVGELRRDSSFYDLLASEARLCSFVAIAQGQVPQENWFALGRLLTRAAGEPVLLSWSGSMFEYLLPLLVMPTYENTLLDQTYRAAVDRRIEYGRQRGVPWGISESGNNTVDVGLNYQYRAFGVPGLGLKRGLADDLVIAPYASVLALTVVPEEACANLQRLAAEGLAGKFGMFDAVDYTPSRLPRGHSKVVVRSFMAHHQGMSLLALAYLLRARPMQKRFESRLEEVEGRLNLIHTLKRKNGGDIPAVLAYGVDARRQLETITGAADRINELEMQEEDLLETLARLGNALSDRRKAAAEDMSRGIEIELDDLKMASAKFGVDFQTRPGPNGAPLLDGSRIAFDQNGFDCVEFLVEPNPGEGLKPQAKIASGGETSRLMLGLKNVMARADEVPSLIFDEIDQGIGGRVGLVVGQKLWNLARLHQVFCVTHLPQLAVFGDQHYQVQKLVQGNRTLTRVERLDGEPRLLELSQMLGEVGEGTLHTQDSDSSLSS